MAADPYAHLAGRFVDHYDTLRGAIRFELISRQLDHHLTSSPQRIVDVGGGAGHHAIRLARAGHEVVLVDPSAEMLSRAEATADALPPDVRSRIRLVRATASNAVGVLDGEQYDAVLCHGVLPYVDEPEQLITVLAGLAQPRAMLSLVFKNADALAMRSALEGRWEDAAEAFDASSDVGGMGVTTRAQSRHDVVAWLTGAGFEVAAWYGIRVMCDHLLDAPASELPKVLPAEAEASRRDPYRALGRLIHLVATRVR